MGIFGWLKPEEEPEDRSLVEISDDQGTHIVVNTPTHDEALDVEGQVRHATGAKSDRDERLSEARPMEAQMEYDSRDPDQLRVRSSRVVDPNEDLEPEEDDDSILEPDEQPATRWWPF